MENYTTNIKCKIKCNRSRCKGFTLAEATIAMVIVGIAAAGVLLPYSSGAAVQAEGYQSTLAAKLAADLIEQILATDYDQIVSTYNGYTESQGQLKDVNGLVFTSQNYSRFSRNVNCQYIYVSQQDGTEVPNFILVTVNIYFDGKRILSINRLISQ